MTPTILLSGSKSGWENYQAAIEAAGGQVAGGYCPPCDPSCDGLLLCGGDDVDPARFGQENAGSKGIDPDRDRAELELAAAYLAAGKPILGICRGHQVLNIALGGTLIQDITPHQQLFHTPPSGESGGRVHPICNTPDSLLHQLYGPVCLVNSYHHQALDALGEGLEAISRSESGLVEAVALPGRPVLGVQFHPERMTGAHLRPDAVDGGAILSWFVDRCKEARHGR